MRDCFYCKYCNLREKSIFINFARNKNLKNGGNCVCEIFSTPQSSETSSMDRKVLPDIKSYDRESRGQTNHVCLVVPFRIS